MIGRRRPAIDVPVGLALLLLGAPASARAQSEPHQEAAPAGGRVVYQDTVVVRSTRWSLRLDDFPGTGTVLPPEQLRQATARSLAEAIRQVPGLNVYDLSGSETEARVESRGFTSLGYTSHLRVMIDEVPVNDLEGDRVDWSLLSLAQVDRVEILRGPASFLYGNAAMAGVINLVTRGTTAGMRPWAQVTSGSGRLGSGVGGASFGTGNAQGSFSAAYQTTDGVREHSAAEHWSGYGQARAQLGAGWVGRARLFAHRGIQNVPGPLPAPDWRDTPERSGTPEDYRDHLAVQGTVEVMTPVTKRFDGLAVLTADARRLDARETVVPVGALDRSSDARAWRSEARFQWRPPGRAVASVLFGGEVEYGRLESRYFDRAQTDPAAPASAGDVLRTSGGIFALVRTSLERSWMLMGGARVDWLRSSADDPTDGAPRGAADRLSAISPTLGLNLKLPRAGHAYAFYAGSFKTPTLEQLYDRRPYSLDLDGPGPMPPFVLNLSNHGLQPQRGYHVESGARAPLGRGLWGDLAVYYARSKDEIGFDLANFRYDNIDRSTHYGIEAQLTGRLAGGVSAQLAYAWTRARFDGGPDDGKQVNGVPEHQISGRLGAEHRLGGSVTLEGRYVTGQWLDEANVHEVAPFAVLDLGFVQSLGRLEIFGAVRNLADRLFAQTGYLTRDAYGADLPLYYPGAGRAFRAGLRVPVAARAAGG